MSVEEKIQEIEDELKRTSYNKATQHHIGIQKAKLAALKEKAESGGGGGGGGGYSVKKSGDSTVAFVGLPSVGKSTLLNQLTNANSKVAAYSFTTLTVIPGTMNYNGANIQIFDLPGIITGAAGGKGRGREVLAVARSADLILIVLDVFSVDSYELILKELYNIGVRPNVSPPDVVIKKASKGGVSISSTVKLTHLDHKDIQGILGQFGVHNASVLLRQNVTADEFIDAFVQNRVYIPVVVALNKVDLVTPEYLAEIKKKIPHVVPISANAGLNMEGLREAIFKSLRLMRIYLRPQGKSADMGTPMVVRSGATVEAVCTGLHREFRRKFRYAQVWGKSAKFGGQKLGLDHKLMDSDILTIVVKR